MRVIRAYELVPRQRRCPGVSVVFASGSEVEIAVAACEDSRGGAFPPGFVSVPCFELFEKQDVDYRRAIIGAAPVRIAVEAGIRQGWDRIIGFGWHLHRHGRLWRQWTGGGALQAFRHHRRRPSWQQPRANWPRSWGQPARNGGPAGGSAGFLPRASLCKPHCVSEPARVTRGLPGMSSITAPSRA